MNQGRVSVSYARALFDWANSKGMLNEVYAQSKQLQQFMIQNPEFGQLLSSPGISIGRKQKVVETLLSEYAPLLTMVVRLTMRNRREKHLPIILLVFQKLYREELGVAKVMVESASELDSNTLKGISSFLGKKLSKEIEIEQRVNQNLIGGFTLTIEDKFMDKSVKGELELFRKKLMGTE
ncbi:MAG: ATP synthase F1 subunit delta [Tenuifilaceae bacterium]|jgi:F-type H+-transporting ATPase subunit delta|nr:ATP synthase F1 subunit delta [Tenuifilaceae bacterium]